MPIPTPPSASQELRADSISAATDGRPVPIALDHTTVGDVTTLHAMTQSDVLDRVWLALWNTHTSAVLVSLVISPADDTVGADVDAATVVVSVPASSALELPALYVRFIIGNAYTIAAYVATADVDRVLVTARYQRMTQGDLTA